MEEIKSLEYLEEIINLIGKNDAKEVLENISYLLADNGYRSARYFIDDLNESNK